MWKKYIPRYTILLLLMAQTLISAEFIRGADITVQTRQDADGVIYYEYGTPTDALSILQNHDFGWIRIRLFHTPQAGDYGVENMDLNYVTDLANRVKAAGFKFLLDIHYSDTWADPTHQWKPAAWANLSQAQLETAVHDYTRDVISHLRNNGVMPEMVQIGNETSYGMLWPNGNITGDQNWDKYAALVNAGIDGVNAGRGNQTMPEIMIHIANGGSLDYSQYFFNRLISNGVNFDVIGLSFYPEWHGGIGDLTNTVNGLAQSFTQDIIVAEVGEYYADNGTATGKSPEGQKQFLEDVIYLVENAPNAKGRGVFLWEPTWLWSGTDGYRALFQPSIDQWGNQDWNDVEMTMGMEAFNISQKFSTWESWIAGTVGSTSGNSVNGTMMESHKSDNQYETITEAISGGKPAQRQSYLEHQWSFNNFTSTNKAITFYVEAHHSSNGEGDNFVFAYSTDGTNFTDMLTVSNTSDTNTPQSFALPAGIDDWITIRVMDTDRTGGNNAADTLYIDNLYLHVAEASGGDLTPPNPNAMTWQWEPYATSNNSIAMQATIASDPSGVEYFFACTAGGGNDSGWQNANTYEDSGLTEGTTYSYTVTARDKSAAQNTTAPSIEKSATTYSGTMVPLVNPSFEADGLASDITPTGWSWNGLGARGITSPASDSYNGAYLGNSAVIYQTTSHTITAAGTQYTLDVDVFNSWYAAPKVVLYYDDAGTRVELGSASLPANGATWAQYNTIQVTASSTAASVGKNIGVELTIDNYPGDYWAHFDYVRLNGGSPQTCTPSFAYINSIVPATANAGKGKKYGQVNITVLNDCGEALTGVIVSGSFSGDYNESQSGITDASGVATLTTTTSAKNPSFTFCVEDVVATLPYSSADNIENCDSL